MKSITIITIVVVALLTIIIFALAWLSYSSCIKSYRLEVNHGKHDKEIYKEYCNKKNKCKKGLVGIICSYLTLIALTSLFVVGIVYKARGENLSINNQVVLVIKSGSMSDYYDEELANEYKLLEYQDLQFDVGDICVFESLTNDVELVKGEVYGYRYKNIIITHRLVEIHEDNLYEFRGDNNSTSDSYYVKGENIIYHYTGQKVPGVGAFILYAQSYFGLWSLLGIIGIAISSEIVYNKIEKINKERCNTLSITQEETQEEKLVEVEFTNDEFSRFIAFILDIKDKARVKKETAFERVVKEIWPQLDKEPTAEAPSKTHEEEKGDSYEK